jgi:hypothetical protein
VKRVLLSTVLAVVVTALSWLSSSPVAAQGDSSAAVSIEILIEGQPADSAPGPTATVGDTLTLDYVITVGGSEELYDLAVRDTSEATPSCDTNGDGRPDGFSVHPGPLTGGAVFTCTATVTAAAADGAVAIIATVSATDFDSINRFEAQDPAHYTPVSPTTTSAPPTTTPPTTSPPTTATPTTSPPTTVTTTTSTPKTDDSGTNPSALGFGDDNTAETARGETMAAIDIEILLDTVHELRSSSSEDTGAQTPSPVVSTETDNDLAWSYVVTNTGKVALDGVEVVAVETTGDGDPRTQTVTCPWEGTGSLPPGRAIRCTASTPAPLTPGPIMVSATARALPPGGEIDTDGGPIHDAADFEVTIEGIDGVAFVDDTPLLFGFGIAFALLAGASLVLWLLSGKPDLDHELP